MKIFITIVLSIVSISVFGQNHLFGLKGGLNLTNISSSNFMNDTDSRTGFSGGLSYEYVLDNGVSFGADIIFNQRGFSNDLIVRDNFGNPTGEVMTTDFNYDYLSLPIKTGKYLGKTIFGFGQIGVVPSILMAAKTFPGSDAHIVTSRVTKFDFAGLVEFGVGYKFNRLWLCVATTYQHSFTTITNSEYFGDSKIRHKGLTLSLGLKYQLTKA
jgi:hypothetical protein